MKITKNGINNSKTKISLAINANVPMDGKHKIWWELNWRLWWQKQMLERTMCDSVQRSPNRMLIKLPVKMKRAPASEHAKASSHLYLHVPPRACSEQSVCITAVVIIFLLKWLNRISAYFPSFAVCLLETVFIFHHGDWALICLPLRYTFVGNHCGEWMKNFCAHKERMRELSMERKRRSKGKCY